MSKLGPWKLEQCDAKINLTQEGVGGNNKELVCESRVNILICIFSI